MILSFDQASAAGLRLSGEPNLAGYTYKDFMREFEHELQRPLLGKTRRVRVYMCVCVCVCVCVCACVCVHN
jgi:hypothetical protein